MELGIGWNNWVDFWVIDLLFFILLYFFHLFFPSFLSGYKLYMDFSTLRESWKKLKNSLRLFIKIFFIFIF
jgi:hypothetical protein